MAVHPGRVSKFDIIFVIVSLKTETCSLTCKPVSVDSQSNKPTVLFLWPDPTQFSDKEVDKKPFNQTLQKLLGGGSGSKERHVLQSTIRY